MDNPDSSLEAGARQETAETAEASCDKPDEFEHELSKAEQHFDEYLKNLKIKVEDGSERRMVGRRARTVSGHWIYVCFPCGAVCGGEAILQEHISGNKHRFKLTKDRVWPISIFDYFPTKKKVNNSTPQVTNTAVPTNSPAQTNSINEVKDEYQIKYEQYRSQNCHLQEFLDNLKSPILGVEYLIEHAPEQQHHTPSYMCTLCMKQGQSLTILNHLTSYWHRYTFLARHFPTASEKLSPYCRDMRYRNEVAYIMSILAQRIEDKYGRKRPVNIDKDEYIKDKPHVHRWVARDHHFSEKDGSTFEEVINEELLESLFNARDAQVNQDAMSPEKSLSEKNLKDSVASLSNSDKEDEHHIKRTTHLAPNNPYKRPAPHALRSRTAKFKPKQPNHAWKQKMVDEMCAATEDSAKQTLAYYTKNPEKHSLYPEEWKMFWKKRYKEIKAEGKDPGKYDFTPEWKVYWTARMKTLHEEELLVQVHEIYRKMGMTPPDENQQNLDNEQKPPKASSVPSSQARDGHKDSLNRRRVSVDRRITSPAWLRMSPDRRRASPDRRKASPDRRRASPDRRGASPDRRRASPDRRRASPDRRRASPDRRRSSPDRRRASPDRRRSSPDWRRSSPDRRRPHPDWRKNDRHRRSADERTVTPDQRTKSLEQRRASSDRHRASFDKRSTSGQRQTSSDRHNTSPVKRTASSSYREDSLDHVTASDRCVASPDRHDASSDQRKASPDQRHVLPGHRKVSSDRHNTSPGRRKIFPERHKASSDQYKTSPDRQRSPDRRRASFDRLRSLPDQRRSDYPSRDQPERPEFGHDRRSPHHNRQLSPERRRSPLRHKRSRSRSPLHRKYRRSLVQNRSHERTRHNASSLKSKIDHKSDNNRLSSWESKNIDPITSRSAATALNPPISDRLDLLFECVLATLRQLVALEDYLGSLGPRITDLLSEALSMEKKRPNSSEDLLERESALVLLETVKEKLKGAAQAGLVSGSAAAAVRAAVVRVSATLYEADKRAKRKKQQSLTTAANVATVSVVGVGEVDRLQIAQQIAAELIAQGKTDVTSEQLAELVEAVVSMAETKKRETANAKITEASDATDKSAYAKLCGTACALQALQAVYETSNKKSKEDSVGVIMDLSDSDVETLLKNFHQLSSEEQYNLAAYLKRLEAKEPQRMERLNQYVNATTTADTRADSQQEPLNETSQQPIPVEAESKGHTDSTIKEVINFATRITQKKEDIVKENIDKPKPEQINHEKSLASYLKDVTKDLASSTDLVKGIITMSKASKAPEKLPSDEVFNFDDLDSFDDLLEDLTSEESSQQQIQGSPDRPATLMTPQPLLPEASSMGSSSSEQGGMILIKNEQERPEQSSPQLKPDPFPTPQNFQLSQQQSYNNLTNIKTQPLEQIRNSKDIRPHYNDNRHQRFQNQFSNRNMEDNRGPAITRLRPNNYPYNQELRHNFMNARGQNNYITRPQNMNNQFGRFDNQLNTFRGIGGQGFYNGGMRGRGRGYF